MRRGAQLSSAFILMISVSAAGCSGQPEETPTGQAQTAQAEAAPLEQIAAGLANGSIRVLDLTQPLTPKTPVIQLPPPFANTPGLEMHQISNYDDKGPGWYWNWMEIGEHVGTHFDAPCHWVTGKDKPCVDAIEAKDFIGPAAVIDVTAEVEKTPDFVATRQTILDWESKHGRIPPRAWVILRTGWGSRAQDAKAFFNAGPDGAPHYPGFGKESAEFLTTERDILGVGTEAIGTDAAIGAQADPAFPNHAIMHGAGKFGLTQLANVASLPPTGAIVIATPLKLERGSGSPVRVIAILPQ